MLEHGIHHHLEGDLINAQHLRVLQHLSMLLMRLILYCTVVFPCILQI